MILLDTITFKADDFDSEEIKSKIEFVKSLPINTQFRGEGPKTLNAYFGKSYVEIIPSQEVDYQGITKIDSRNFVTFLRGTMTLERSSEEGGHNYFFYTSPEDYEKYKVEK